MAKSTVVHGLCLVEIGIYTDEELEVIKAMDQHIHRTGRKFPSFVEVFHVIEGLGYRRQGGAVSTETEAERESRIKQQKADRRAAQNRKDKEARRKAGNERARRGEPKRRKSHAIV